MTEPRTLRLLLCTPFGEEAVEGVRHLRLEGLDGSRGVQPGHEPALMSLKPGAMVVLAAEESFVATEGGFAWIQPDAVRVITRWAAHATNLDELLEQLGSRARRRRHLERNVHAQLQSHEAATRRALIGLQREVSR